MAPAAPDYSFKSVAKHVAARDSAKAFLEANAAPAPAPEASNALAALAGYGEDDDDVDDDA